MNDPAETTRTLEPKDYKSSLNPIWCKGCGDFGVLNAITKAFSELQIPRHKICIVTGIGCSSRLPGYLSTYGFNSLHGRAVPIATGVKLASPDTTVFVAGGDGDGFSIGGGHLPHAARRNIDMTYLVMDNRVYGLTKGQASPTTPLESYTSTTQYGSYEPPLNMVQLMLAYRTSFIARGFAGDIKGLADLIVQGIRHPGFSFIQVLSPCVTYRGKKEYDYIRSLSSDTPHEHDPMDFKAAWDLAGDPDNLYMGVLYKNTEMPSYIDRLIELRKISKSKGVTNINELINEFRP